MADLSDSRTPLIAAFTAVYLIWGSTYLAIRFAIETMPPFTMAGVRFVIAGGGLYAWLRLWGVGRPKPIHWRTAFVVGGLMLLGGNGGVVWAELSVPSGLAALVVATVPLWMVLLLVWLSGRGRPSVGVVVGLVVGFGGVAWLIGPERIAGGERIEPIGALVLVSAALAWAMGSLYFREAPHHPSQPLATAMSMLAGGALLLALAGATGEYARLDLSGVSLKSWIAFWYLVLFGALVGLSAYLWLMRTTTPARAATYAYVNPVVAVVLGWLLAGEPLNPRVMIAAGVIVGAVALIVTGPGGVSRNRVCHRRAATDPGAP